MKITKKFIWKMNKKYKMKTKISKLMKMVINLLQMKMEINFIQMKMVINF